MKFFLALALVSVSLRAHWDPKPIRLPTGRHNQVLPQFVEEVEVDDHKLPVCGVDGKTYPSRHSCPVGIAYAGECRPQYAYDTYWYMPHGWELYQQDGQPKRSRDLWGYHQHVMPPYFHA